MGATVPARPNREWLTLENLEPRILLSAESITGADRAALMDGLTELIGFAESVERFGDLDTAMPITGQAIGQWADFSDILDRGLVQPLDGFLIPDGTQTAADVVGFLGGPQVNRQLPGGLEIEVLSPSQVGADLAFTISLTAWRTVDYGLDLGTVGSAAGLVLPGVGLVTGTVDYQFDFDFTFGLDSSGTFYVEADDLTVSASVRQTVERTAEDAPPAGGALTADVVLTLLINGDTTVAATLPMANYPDGASVEDLAAALNSALSGPLDAADLPGSLETVARNGRLTLAGTTAAVHSLSVTGGEALGFHSDVSSTGPIHQGLDLGFVSLDVSGGTALLDTSIDVDISPGADGRLTLDELDTPTVQLGSLVALFAGGTAEAALPVMPTQLSLLIDGWPMVVATGADVFAAEPLSIEKQGLDQIDALNEQARDAIADGLDGLADWIEGLEQTGALADEIPALGGSVGEAFGLGEIIRSWLAEPVASYLAAGEAATADGLRAVLAGLDGTSEGVSLTLTAAPTVSKTGDALEFTLAMDVERTTRVPLELAEDLAAERLVLDSPQEVDLVTSTSLELAFGTDREKLPSAGDAFFVRLGDGFAVTAAVDEAGLTQGGTVGFLEVEVQGGTAVVNAEVAVDLADIDGRMTLSQMRSDLEQNLAVQAGTGSLGIVLPLGFATGRGIPGVIEAGQTPRIILYDANLFDATGTGLALEHFDTIADFRSITAQELLAPLATLGDWMDRLGAMPAFDEWVPLTADLGMGYVVDPGAGWRQHIGDLLSEEVTTDSGFTSFEPTYATAQDLADLLGDIVGTLQYDAASHELSRTN